MALIKCDHCGRVWHDCAVRNCPHPNVIKLFGNRIFHICRECCLKCKHHTKENIGIGCDLWIVKRVKTMYNKNSR